MNGKHICILLYNNDDFCRPNVRDSEHEFVKGSYVLCVHAVLERHYLSDRSLSFAWKGTYA